MSRTDDNTANAETPLTSVSDLSFLPSIPWTEYVIPNSSLSKDRTTVATSDPSILYSANALAEFIRAQSALPPVPEICITGSHKSNRLGEDSSMTKVDFDIKLKMLQYLLPKTPKPGPGRNTESPTSTNNFIRVRASDGTARLVGTAPGSDLTRIRALASKFIEEKTKNKCLVLNRVVTNWHKDYLKGCILSLLADLQYRGNITIKFPVLHAKVIVQPEKTVVDSFKALFIEKKFVQELDAVWQYADQPPSSGSGKGKATDVNVARTFAVRSEQGWWDDWKGAIGRAVLEGRKGHVGADDLLEMRLGFPGPARKGGDWGGNAW